MSGARAALDYFHVPDVEQHATEYAQRKQEMVVRLIEAGDFTAYPDALRFVIAVKDAGLLIADASSSKNAGLFLRKIRLDTFAQEQGISSPSLRPGLSLLDYFDADVSGRDFAHGKPDPEIFLTAAHQLGVEPRYAMVSRTRPPVSRRRRPAAWRRSGSPEAMTLTCSPRPTPTRRHHARRRRHRSPRRRTADRARPNASAAGQHLRRHVKPGPQALLSAIEGRRAIPACLARGRVDVVVEVEGVLRIVVALDGY